MFAWLLGNLAQRLMRWFSLRYYIVALFILRGSCNNSFWADSAQEVKSWQSNATVKDVIVQGSSTEYLFISSVVVCEIQNALYSFAVVAIP